MANAYVSIMIQSLKKKEGILDKIQNLNMEQKDQLEDPNLDPEDFDQVVGQKAALIDEMEQLDEGFQELFLKVREELDEKREVYKDEIRRMQDLIRRLTEKSMTIQRQEAQNKQLMEQKFTAVHRQVKEVRQSQKVVNQYYKNMMKTNYIDPQFLDNKK